MKPLIPMIFLMLVLRAAFGQDLTGDWKGVLEVQGTRLRIVFHITKVDGQYTATMDSPDQYVSGFPVTAIDLHSPTIRFQLSTIGAIYEGEWSDNRITGKWMQAGKTFPLVLLKDEDQPGEG